ncbi:zinc-binding dehydrogenase family protein [Stylonychia lemnae]|uniref:Zinc-binding dehydrogenase family protein n=1 Tax=Stylonychia lemnae TaxID=5949 RepID=A0A078AXL2_STYLE|nr:zinc-binding dehydrogenase family protein [Stylonychia lemnae]|eukprot:CDW86811.1 zinc-binding dehydrogenase family protein [Stylonychia lemnae]
MVESQQYKYVKNVDGEFQIVSEDIPRPGAGQALIKIAYSAINSYDEMNFTIFKSQRIGSVGEDTLSDLIGKKVSFLAEAWGQYRLADINTLIVLDDSQDLAKAANASGNPLTALGQLDLVKNHGAKAVVLTSATSQLGKQFLRLCLSEGIQVINIVRRQEAINQLKDECGAHYVLNSTSPTFLTDLQILCDELQPTYLIDYIGGNLIGQIFTTMPQSSHLLTVGNQSGETMNLNSGDILFKDKTVSGFMLNRFLQSISLDDRRELMQRISNDLRDGGKIFGSNIVKEIPLENFKEGLQQYQEVASEGKILINCQ